LPTTALFHMRPDLQADLTPGQLPEDSPVRPQFASAGIVLAPEATVAVVTPGQLWTITDFVPGSATARAAYRIRLTTRTTGNTSKQALYVFLNNVPTPAMPPGWSDFANALGKPPTGTKGPNNDLTKGTTIDGPPFPQLVAAAGVGAMSLNYRSEPA